MHLLCESAKAEKVSGNVEFPLFQLELALPLADKHCPQGAVAICLP